MSGKRLSGKCITSEYAVIRAQSLSVCASVISETVLFGEVDATQ
jgi:hypothetical protein